MIECVERSNGRLYGHISDSHSHVNCLDTDKILDIHIELPPELLAQVEQQTGVKITDYQINFYGYSGYGIWDSFKCDLTQYNLFISVFKLEIPEPLTCFIKTLSKVEMRKYKFYRFRIKLTRNNIHSFISSYSYAKIC